MFTTFKHQEITEIIFLHFWTLLFYFFSGYPCFKLQSYQVETSDISIFPAYPCLYLAVIYLSIHSLSFKQKYIDNKTPIEDNNDKKVNLINIVMCFLQVLFSLIWLIFYLFNSSKRQIKVFLNKLFLLLNSVLEVFWAIFLIETKFPKTEEKKLSTANIIGIIPNVLIFVNTIRISDIICQQRINAINPLACLFGLIYSIMWVALKHDEQQILIPNCFGIFACSLYGIMFIYLTIKAKQQKGKQKFDEHGQLVFDN